MGQLLTGVSSGPEMLCKKLNLNPNVIIRFSSILDYIRLSETTRVYLEKEKPLVILGGDHSISSSTVPIFFDKYRENGHLLWIDAHPDLNTHKTSITKNEHGMSVAKIFNLTENHVNPLYTPRFDQLSYYGIRSIDPPEKDFINTYKISTNIDYENIKDKDIYVSLDVDVLDPSIISSTGTPVNDGANITEIINILKPIWHRVKCIDIVEFNPEVGCAHKSLNNIGKIWDAINK